MDRNDDLVTLYRFYHIGEALAFCHISASTITGIFTSANGEIVTLIYVIPDGQDSTTAVSSLDTSTTDISQAKSVVKSSKPTETPQTDNEADGPDGPDNPDGDSNGCKCLFTMSSIFKASIVINNAII